MMSAFQSPLPGAMPCCVCAGRKTVLVADEGEQSERRRCPVCSGTGVLDPMAHAAAAKAMTAMGFAREAFAGSEGGMN